MGQGSPLLQCQHSLTWRQGRPAAGEERLGMHLDREPKEAAHKSQVTVAVWATDATAAGP